MRHADSLQGKSFGARKTAVLRVVSRGYSPACTQITVSVRDRDRLRKYASENGVSMVDAFSGLLTKAGVKAVQKDENPVGILSGLIDRIRNASGEQSTSKLLARIRAGEFDPLIASYQQH